MSSTNDRSSSSGLILVTGAASYVGAAILTAVLTHGYQVRLVARSEEKAKKLREHFNKIAEVQNVAIVEDFTVPGAFDKAVAGCTGVIHTASPFSFTPTDVDKDILAPAIDGTKVLLQSIAQHAPTVKRVVLTSSLAAVIDVPKGYNPGYTYTENDWNPATREQAIQMGDAVFAYCTAKALSEKAAWDFVQGKTGASPNFSVIAICPGMCYGPPEQPLGSMSDLTSTSQLFYGLMTGGMKDVPPTPFPVWCDTRDVALAHVKALEHPNSGRYLLTTGKYIFNDIPKTLKEVMPEIAGQVTDPGTAPIPESYDVDSSKTIQEFDLKLTPWKTTVLDMAKKMSSLQKSLA